MADLIKTPEDVVNVALSHAGFSERVNSFYEGSLLARKTRDIYGQSRDELIRNGEWEFAERVVNGAMLKQAPAYGYVITPWTSAYPAPPWLFEYSYPSDCIKLRSVRAAPVTLPNFSPIYNRFSVENDNGYTPPRKVILCDVAAAIVTYAGQVTDPTTWESDFIEALAASLGRRFSLLKDQMTEKMEAGDEQIAINAAMDERG